MLYRRFAVLALFLCLVPSSVFGVPCKGQVLSEPFEDYEFDSKLSIIEFATSVTYIKESAGKSNPNETN